MTNLSPNLARMIEASRRLHSPSDAERSRVGSAIERRLVVGAAAAAIAGTSKAVAATASKGGLLGALVSSGSAKIIVASAILAGSGVATWRLVASTSPPSIARTATPSNSSRGAVADTSAAPRVATSSAEGVTTPAPATPAPQPARTASTNGSAPSSPSPASMARELELVRSAQTALESGDAPGALAVLDRYQREFSSGMLAQEAATVRILALCGAGRTDEGLALAQRFLRAQPGSPFARRVRTACGVAAPGSTSKP